MAAGSRSSKQARRSGHESRVAGIVDRIRRIPSGSVQTYGEIDPVAPRLVGLVLATTHHDLPWQRVIRADGGIPKGQRQRELLRWEGVPMRGDRVDIDRARILSSLPAVVADYLRAADACDVDALVLCFTNDAEITDEGRTWYGHAEIRRWREGPATTYEYRVELRGRQRITSHRHIVRVRLTGNFPGGNVDLRYRFTLRAGLISVLKIAP